MKGSEFIFDDVMRESYIKSFEWLEDKKATINPKNKNDDKCFQYALTVALNYEKINKNRHRISKKKN